MTNRVGGLIGACAGAHLGEYQTHSLNGPDGNNVFFAPSPIDAPPL